MGDGQEQDQYEERLREVFNGFDASGRGSLSPDELSDLCRSLHLHDETPALLRALLQDQDRLTARVDFDQFKNALILVLSSSLEQPPAEQETLQEPESPEIQPKFVKGSKRYGRRSTPEFIECASDEVAGGGGGGDAAGEQDLEDGDDSAVPRKRERWNAYKTETEEYEAEGQMHLWNPDEPSTPRGGVAPPTARLEERLRDACEELGIAWDGSAGHGELLALCERLGLEMSGDVLLGLHGDGTVDVQEFVSRVVTHNKPPTPSASTPYRQLKRLHSTQPFDEGGRRIATPAALSSSIGMRLFSTLDDGSGFTAAECVLDAWIDEGIENSAEILQALNFDLDGKLSLGDLTLALENELLVTKNGIHQAALASFKAEIRHLLERVDREIREKDKIRSDLEKAERLKTQFAAEVDEHHSAIEHMNNLNLRKLEQEHREKLAAARSELMKEMDHMQQQAGLQREELEAEIQKIREDESFLRDHLSIAVKENRRLEMELLDSTEKLDDAQSHISKLQTNLDKIMKDKFGDLDPGSADFLLQEERIKQLRGGYEAQCRELQDRIDELQSELQEFHSLGRAHQPCSKPLSEELESKSPGMESDPGIGSEEVQPFSMSLEAEMMLEQLKEQHLQEMEDLRNQLENKISEFDKMVEKQRTTHEDQKLALSLKYQQEVQALQAEMASAQSHAQELQSQLEQAEQEQSRLEQQQAAERAELDSLQEEEVGDLRQQLLEAHNYTADLEEQLKALEEETGEDLRAQMEELTKQHAEEVGKLKEEQAELLEARLAEERKELQEEKVRSEQSLLAGWESEKKVLQESYEEKLEEAKSRFEEEREETARHLTEEWQKERARLDEQNNESLQALLEDEMLRLVREQEEKEGRLKEQWEQERARLREQQEEALLGRLQEEQLQFEQREKKLREEWERERLQLEEDYEGMIQDRLSEEREKLQAEQEEEDRRAEQLIAQEKERLQERHREAVKELRAKHAEERDALGATLDKLRDEIAQERKEIEISFNQKIREVEDRFSGEQETVAQRFQADVSTLERRYRNELASLSESHEAQRLQWEAQMEEALRSLEEQRGAMEEAMERERERLAREWAEEHQELEGVHGEETEALLTENRRLQGELEEMVSGAQTKEIELSRQLNELHARLQESLNTNHELLSQAEHKAVQLELLLNQTVEDFKQERAELQGSGSELEAKHGELLAISERQVAERIELLTERDDLRMKIEELETLLKQAAVDFEQERKELQENLSALEKTLGDGQEIPDEDLRAERDELRTKVEELEEQLREASNSAEKDLEEPEEEETAPDTEDDPDESERSRDVETQTEIPRDTENLVQDHVEEEGDDEEEEGKEIQAHQSLLEEMLKEVEDRRLERDALKIRVEELEMQLREVSNSAEKVEGEDLIASNETLERMKDLEEDDCLSEEPNHTQFEQNGDEESCAIDEDEDEDGSSACEDQEEQTDLREETETCDFPLSVCDLQLQDSFPESFDLSHVVCESPLCEHLDPETCSGSENENPAVPCETQRDPFSSLEAFADPENKVILQPRSAETKPQDAAAEDDEAHHETSVELPSPEETCDLDETSQEDPEVDCLQNNSHENKQELVLEPPCEHSPTEVKRERARDRVDAADKDGSLLRPRTLCDSDADENVLLHEKIFLLQQKTEILEHLLAHNGEKMKSCHQVLEENYSLKVKTLLLVEHAQELEMKALKTAELQIRYEDCMCENVKLKDQNAELEKRVWILEGGMNLLPGLREERLSLVDEISRMRAENRKLSEMFEEEEEKVEVLPDGSGSPGEEEKEEEEEEEEEEEVSDLEDCCLEFERQNSKLRRAITDLRDETQTLNETTQTHRSEAGRLAEENVVLRKKIAALKSEDLKDVQEELAQTLERLNKEKFGSRKAAETFKKQISELRLQKQQLQDENRLLKEKNTWNVTDVGKLRRQLTEESQASEAFPAEERNKLAACVCALEAELTKALEDTAQLEERNVQLSQELSDSREKALKLESVEVQLGHLMEERNSLDEETFGLRSELAKVQEKVKTSDETVLVVNRQGARLKSDLRAVQQEKDSLKREVTVLHKQLQNANDKNHVLEMALHSSGLQSHSKKLYRDEMWRLREQEQQLLRQENERLQSEVRSVKGDLVLSREKVRQLDATVLSLKQHKPHSPSSVMKTLEQENLSLKQELEAQKELNKDCEAGQKHSELESLQQENEALKAQMTRLSTQLLEAFQAQLVGLLPPSPHRIPRGQHRGDDPDNVQQDDKEKKMKNMEERMREIELSLHNVKLLLREKVNQLKVQLHKNGKADVLIKDLYVENSQLLKSLELTEQRHKIAEKKNYLLEEKISSLNKIVRDLNPSPLPPLPPLPYHYNCS